MTPYETWLESGAALRSAWDWFNPEHLLDAYLAARQSDTDFRQWCDDQIREGLAERARLEAG